MMTLPGGGVGGPVFAVGVASGIGTALAAVLAQAFADGVSAGVGTASGDFLGQASATAVTSGVAVADGQAVSSAFATAMSAGVSSVDGQSISISSSTALALGTGTALGDGFSWAFSTAASAGFGDAQGILTAQVFSVGTAAGSGTADGQDSPASVAEAQGFGIAIGVSYAFYADAEMAAPANEVRVVYVPWAERNPIEHVAMVPAEPRETYANVEYRVAVAQPEDRVYYTQRKPRVSAPPNRRRKP